MVAIKRLVFLNRSFFPDIEATGQLLTELCQELASDFDVHVVCGHPLYRQTKRRWPITKTTYDNVTIWRINNTTLPKKYFWARFINLLSYFVGCFFWIFFLKDIDCIIAETDPPLLASVAYIHSRLRHCPFIYYSQDIWPEVGLINKGLTNPLITRLLKAINNFLYKKAALIIVPGRDMKIKIEKKITIHQGSVKIVENWIDPQLIYPIKRENNIFLKRILLRNKFIVVYSGNIGLSQDLENVILVANDLKTFEDIFFLVIGEGASKEKLIKLASYFKLKNLKFLPYQAKKYLAFSLSAADIHLITLKKGMKGVIIPSKVYGIMAAGRPFIAAVDKGSEIDLIVKEFQCGLVIEPSNKEELKKAVRWAFDHRSQLEKMGQRGREAIEKHFSKKICTQKFKRILEEVV